MKALSAGDPRLEPHALADFTERTGASTNRDLARIMGLRSLVEPDLELMPEFPSGTETVTTQLPNVEDMWVTTSQDASLPRLLVFRDLFYFWLAKFVEPHFSETTVVHYNRLGDGASMNDWIRKAAPDIVIIEVVEELAGADPAASRGSALRRLRPRCCHMPVAARIPGRAHARSNPPKNLIA